MTEPIVYKSDQKYAYSGPPKQLEKKTKAGLSWEWNYSEAFASFDSWRKIDNCAYLSWKFEWNEEEMKKNGVYGFEGMISVWNLKRNNSGVPLRFKVILIKSGECIKKRMGTIDDLNYTSDNSDRYFRFEFTLNKITKPEICIHFPDHLMDSNSGEPTLIVDGQKIVVNKNYLSFRSEYFNTLFNSDFKEKSMDEIPIDDVKYQDFNFFLKVIHPTNPEPPTDETVEILLELADRFIMPAVTRQIEQHLFTNNSDLSFGKILELAEKYNFENLFNQCLGMLGTVNNLKNFKKSIDYAKLSDSTRLKLLDCIIGNLD